VEWFRSIGFTFQRWLAFVTPWIIVRALAADVVRPLRTRKILVLGSSPTPRLPLDLESWELWAVNASVRQADRLGLGPPAVTVVDRGLFTEPTRSGALRQVRNLDLGRVVSVSTVPLSRVARCPSNCLRVSRYRRSLIVRAATGSRTIDSGTFAALSTGGFAVCLASLAASDQIFLAGFSMTLTPGTKSTPHFYYDENITPSVLENTPDQLTARKHSAADSASLSLIALRKSNVLSLEPDLVPLLRNWGQDPPEWWRAGARRGSRGGVNRP